jgi:hypothetical protein
MTTTTKCTSPAIPSTCAHVIPGCGQPNIPMNVSNDISNRAQYLESQEHELTKSFMVEIGFTEHKDFFTDDIISDDSLMKTLASLSYSWNNFSALKKSYSASSQKGRKSHLKDKLHEVGSLCNELVDC